MRGMMILAMVAMGCTGGGGTSTTTGGGGGGGTLTLTGAINGMGADYGADDYAPGTQESVYSLGISDVAALNTLGTLSLQIDVTGDVTIGDVTSSAHRWTVIMAPSNGKQWTAHYDETSPNSTVGTLTFDVTSSGPSTREMSSATHTAYQVHGTADATLDPVNGTGASDIVTLHATF